MLLPMDIAPEDIIAGCRGAILVFFRQRGVKFKGHRLPWIDANSSSSCCLDQGSIARNAERDIAEQCGHKLMRHEIPVAKLKDRRHPCYESKPTICPPFCDVKGFLADINGHVNFSTRPLRLVFKRPSTRCRN